MRRHVAVIVGLLGLFAIAPALAQDAERLPRRGPVQQRVESPPVDPAPIEAEPELEAHLAFQRSLDELGEHSRREARLAEVRRVAPFDLDWGLR